MPVLKTLSPPIMRQFWQNFKFMALLSLIALAVLGPLIPRLLRWSFTSVIIIGMSWSTCPPIALTLRSEQNVWHF